MDTTPRGELAAKRAVEWLRVLADTWVNSDVPDARADLLHAIYDRIVVVGRSIVAARLTPAAYSNGLALALPQVVMARPTASASMASRMTWASTATMVARSLMLAGCGDRTRGARTRRTEPGWVKPRPWHARRASVA